MKKTVSIIAALALVLSCTAPKAGEGTVSVIPKPQHLQMDEGSFTITKSTPIFIEAGSEELSRIAGFLNEKLSTAAGFELPVREADLSSKERGIYFLDAGLPTEAYELRVEPDRIVVDYGDGAGAFYGLQTLFQLLPAFFW